jgi:hypothetical protein
MKINDSPECHAVKNDSRIVCRCANTEHDSRKISAEVAREESKSSRCSLWKHEQYSTFHHQVILLQFIDTTGLSDWQTRSKRTVEKLIAALQKSNKSPKNRGNRVM